MNIPTVSILTLVKRRESHLTRLVSGLCQSAHRPDELIVVRMNEPERPLSAQPFKHQPFAHQQIVLSSSDALPLAAARNAAAAAASGKFLIFLDVDCIPDHNCIREYLRGHAAKPNAVLMGAVYYLDRPLSPAWPLEQLQQTASPHLLRDPRGQTFLQPEPDYNLFWTLSFGLSRRQFERVGGFCEAYRGYGAEDTDFARLIETQSIELCWVPSARAYHQYHASQVPPYRHLDSIVGNAQIYYDRWGRWPMEKWLSAFAQAGYIEWSPDAIAIRQRRRANSAAPPTQ